MAPAPVKIHESSEIGPVDASDDGSPITPEPTMLPITSAVAIYRPSDRLSFGRATSGTADWTSETVDMIVPPSSRRMDDSHALSAPGMARRIGGAAVFIPGNYGQAMRGCPDVRSPHEPRSCRSHIFEEHHDRADGLDSEAGLARDCRTSRGGIRVARRAAGSRRLPLHRLRVRRVGQA